MKLLFIFLTFGFFTAANVNMYRHDEARTNACFIIMFICMSTAAILDKLDKH